MTETEEKLRGMGVTMDQRRRLMMASKLGLGPLGQLSVQSEDRSRSPSRQPSPPTVSSQASALVAFAPGGHMVPAQNAEAAKRRLADQAARARAISKGGNAVKAMTSAVVQAREEEEDLDSFLAGGRKMAVQAAKVMEDKRKKLVIEQASQENLQKSADAARRAEAERQAQERKEAEARQRQEDERRKREEERQREEEKQEERRRRKEEEKRRKREEKEKSKDSDEADAGRTDKVASGPGGLFKAVMKENETKRQHWGESVKGRVSSDYKGLTDAELERRFASPGGNASEKLMTEQEVLAMLRKGKDGKEKKK